MKQYEVRCEHCVWFVIENASGMGMAEAICFSEVTARKICNALNEFKKPNAGLDRHEGAKETP